MTRRLIRTDLHILHEGLDLQFGRIWPIATSQVYFYHKVMSKEKYSRNPSVYLFLMEFQDVSGIESCEIVIYN